MAKSGRDPERTRAKILHHATAEFSTKGFDGARVDKIADRCRVSKNMLYYYFGSKENLYIAVLEGAYEKLRARQGDISMRSQDPLEALASLVEQTFTAFAEAPEVISLLNQENMYKGRYIKKSKRLRELYDPLQHTLTEVVNRGQAAGVFRPDIDPLVLYLSLSSLAYHYLSNQYTLGFALGVQFTSPKARQTWLAHITDMITTFCKAQGDTSVAAPRLDAALAEVMPVRAVARRPRLKAAAGR
jgi:TetR/AcrR family transcriptional regulator